LVSDQYLVNGILNSPPIRHLGTLVYEVLYLKGGKSDRLLTNPRNGQPMPYIPLLDCLLDMPYPSGTMVVFQSTCGGK
jgi:hypothetical protein